LKYGLNEKAHLLNEQLGMKQVDTVNSISVLVNLLLKVLNFELLSRGETLQKFSSTGSGGPVESLYPQ
jgi:hypothetical protein